MSEIENKAFEDLQNFPRFKKPVESVKLKGVGFPIVAGVLSTRTLNALEVSLEGQKKKAEISIFHSFCPFVDNPPSLN